MSDPTQPNQPQPLPPGQPMPPMHDPVPQQSRLRQPPDIPGNAPPRTAAAGAAGAAADQSEGRPHPTRSNEPPIDDQPGSEPDYVPPLRPEPPVM